MGQMMGGLKNSMPGGTDVADPGQSWGNMDPSQRTVAGIGGAAKGLGQGMQAYQQQNSAMRNPGGGQMPPAAAPDPQAPQFGTGNMPGGGAPMMPGMPGGAPKMRNPMFYGA